MSTTAKSIHPDPIRGHIGILTDSGQGASFCDVGPTLDLWAGQTIRFTPITARELGEALIDWADRKEQT